MYFSPPLESARLIRRYKRFLADIELPSGETTTIHCANTGKMTGCATPGDTIWYSRSSNLKRKYPFSWELTQTQLGDQICVNTIRANSLAVEAIQSGVITELQGYDELKTEVKYGSENSRIDILLTQTKSNSLASPQASNQCYVEVKSVTLLEDDLLNEGNISQGYFPDTVSVRGQKHLRELIEVVKEGHRAVLLFAVLHSGIKTVAPAHHIDPQYGQLLLQAIDAGVEVLCYQAQISPENIMLKTAVNFDKTARTRQSLSRK